MEMSYCTIKKSFLVKMGYLLRHINIAIGQKNSILLKQESSHATQQGRNKTRKVGMRVLSVLIFTENVSVTSLMFSCLYLVSNTRSTAFSFLCIFGC